ncbi:hypothetical protein Trydic_g4893 [Trypoxylus dichotomus]
MEQYHPLKKSGICTHCNVLSSDINDLKAAILSLRNDLAAREKSAGIDDKAFEELLAELGDRNNRKQNIIMFGVPESDTHDANTRRSRELETVQAVLKALPSGMNTDHIEVHRIGRFVPDRRRPIKVRLSSSREAHTVLKHAKRLRENEQYVWKSDVRRGANPTATSLSSSREALENTERIRKILLSMDKLVTVDLFLFLYQAVNLWRLPRIVAPSVSSIL